MATLAEIMNKAAEELVPASGGSSISTEDIIEPTEEDLARLSKQGNLLARKMIVDYNNWVSRRGDNRGQVFCTFGLIKEPLIDEMTNAEVIKEIMDDHKKHGCQIFIPAPDNNGILRDVRLISFNEEANSVTAVDDAARDFVPAGASTLITRKKNKTLKVEDMKSEGGKEEIDASALLRSKQ